jgi:hypothetical protein
MPAIAYGLGLADRVVRRHVAKLQAVGWCERRPALRGDGSSVWMTATGLAGVELGNLPAVRAPDPFSIQTMRTVGVAWIAAAIEAAGHQWRSPRELALAPDRWGAQVANERGGTSRRLPDLVFWPASDNALPVAVVVEHGPPKPRRERAALEGWKSSIAAGRYAQVRYVARRTAAGRVVGLATQLDLTETQFIAGERVVTDEPLPPVDPVESHPETPAPPEPAAATVPSKFTTFDRVSRPAAVTTPGAGRDPEQVAQRQRRIRELLGQDEPGPRRRWRRRST